MLSILNCFFPLSDLKLVNTVHEDPPINSVKLVLQEIFSHLDLPSLAKSCRVCKSWNNAGREPLVWKTVIFRHSFNNDKWAKCFGEEVVADEDREEEWKSLPITIVDEFINFHHAYPKIKFKDGLMLVRLPKTLNGELTLNSFIELTKKHGMGLRYIWNLVIGALGDRSIAKSRWVLMAKKVLPGTENKNFETQTVVVDNLAQKGLIGWEFPETLEAVTCILAQYYDSKTYLYSFSFEDRLKMMFFLDKVLGTRCKETIQGYHVKVGLFEKNGLTVYNRATETNYSDTGVAVVLRF